MRTLTPTATSSRVRELLERYGAEHDRRLSESPDPQDRAELAGRRREAADTALSSRKRVAVTLRDLLECAVACRENELASRYARQLVAITRDDQEDEDDGQ